MSLHLSIVLLNLSIRKVAIKKQILSGHALLNHGFLLKDWHLFLFDFL
jgi:hypothetical protein